MTPTPTILFCNGQFVEKLTAFISPMDRGLTLGDGIFETIRINTQREAPLLPYHWDRLCSSLQIVDCPNPTSYENLSNIIGTLLQKNNIESNKDAFARVMITRGEGVRGVLPPPNPTPTLIITVGSVDPMNKDFALCIAQSRRNEYSILSTIKSTNYLDNIIARTHAHKNHFDDALFLNTAGNVTETTMANVFICKNGAIFTPPVSDGVLPGITRKVIIEQCSKSNIPIFEQTLSKNDLADADEIFMTNSLIKIQPVVKIENISFTPKGREITELISALFEQFLTEKLTMFRPRL